MAVAWLLWLGIAVGVVFAVLLTAAGLPVAGLFLAAIVVLAARSAVAPAEREHVEDSLRDTRNRIPFCNCGKRLLPGSARRR